jgi:hypothetical protein
MTMQMAPALKLGVAMRAELVAIREELRDVLVRIDDETIDWCDVDFGALAKRLEECNKKMEGLPATGDNLRNCSMTCESRG